MAATDRVFPEARLGATPIQKLGLTIEGTWLEPIITEFQGELDQAGIVRVRPRFYLSTEWGVNTGTVSIGIPFYLASAELLALHRERVGHVEGTDGADILRYLRHEMGHVVNYAYRLYEREAWVRHFGSFTQPYVEEYRPTPFSRRYVRHLPGWYAQKHPDEDWAETFAVWMTPGKDWRRDYAEWPTALAKLEYCDRLMAELKDRDPLVTEAPLPEDVSELSYSVDDYYRRIAPTSATQLPGLDGALLAIFEDIVAGPSPGDESRPASALIRRLERNLMASVYRWTGHFPEHTRSLLRHLASRADALGQVYRTKDEIEVIITLTTLVTALAMNHVYSGSYQP